MCYDVTSGLKALIKYAKHRNEHPDYVGALEKKLEDWIKQLEPHHHVSGFLHPKLMVFTNSDPQTPQAFYWGLIPAWTKNEESAKQIIQQTLNARSESMFEKPAFRASAKNKRCLVYVDAFFEHHHLNGKTYPFKIESGDGAPLALAGLWDEWINTSTGECLSTVSLVTCKANLTMSKIHNNPKLTESRMPVILPQYRQDEWLAPCESEQDVKQLLALCIPYPDNYLTYRTVGPLRGKRYLGDVPETGQAIHYPELDTEFPGASTA